MAHTVGRTVEGLGYEFVDAERLAGGLLRVTIDRDGGVQLADCERVSRQLTHLLAVENVDYARLEVSSPGLDRPLRSARDFARFAGLQAQVQLYAPLLAAGNRRRLRGRVLDVTGAVGAERVRLQLAEDDAAGAVRSAKRGKVPAKRLKKPEGAVVEFALADVERAKLVPELDFRGGARSRQE
ncbi:MAG TPA: ribosome maturation factor RimP [Burkholderiaceae bacterium]|nr:ribosome maturation factor RimP [Burkholderiaceae bacterium]